MVINIWYPVIKDWTPRYNGNWAAANGQTLMYSHCFGTTAERSHCGQHIIHDRNKEDRKAQYTQYYQTGICIP